MEVKNCERCKRLFNYISGHQICPVCKELLDKKLKKAKTYLLINPNATIDNVVINCDVEKDQVHQWIRDKKLNFSSKVNTGLTCKKCGTEIVSGRYCDKCKAYTINDLNILEASLNTNKEISPKMRYFNTKEETRKGFYR